MIRFPQTLFVLLFILVVKSEEVVHIPTTDLLYQTQRASTLPITLECPSPIYKFIEVGGVTLANETDVIIAETRYQNINEASNAECRASLMVPTNERAHCTVSMKDITFDEETKGMDKVVVFDCRKTLGDSSNEIKIISKKKGTINIKCPNKDDVPGIISITLASGIYVNVVETAWKCSEENVNNMGKGQNGGHCQIQRPGYLNNSKMTVKYKCSSPPRRDFQEFIYKEGGEKRGKTQGK